MIVPAVKLIVGVPTVVRLLLPLPIANVPEVFTVSVPVITKLAAVAILRLPDPSKSHTPFAPIVWLPLATVKVAADCSQVPFVNVIAPGLAPASDTFVVQITLFAIAPLFNTMLLNRVGVPLPEIVWSPALVKVTVVVIVLDARDMSNVPLLVRLPPIDNVLTNTPAS